MFNTFKSFFGITAKAEPQTSKDNAMAFGQINFTGDKFSLFYRGEQIGTYSRKRDAVRGASRRNIPLAA